MLPELPKQLKRREADFGVEFRHWWEKNRINGDFELKHTRGAQSLPFTAVENEQIAIGKSSQSAKGTLLRLTHGTIGSPDYSAHIGRITWIVIRYPDAFFLISLDTFLLEKSRSKRKSLTKKRAGDIATYSVVL